MAARGQAASRLNEQRRKRKEEEERKKKEEGSSAPTSSRATTRRRELAQRGKGDSSSGASNGSSGGVAGRSRGTGARGSGPSSRRPGNPRAARASRASGPEETGGFRKATAADVGSGSAAPRLPASGSSGQTFSQAFAAARKAQGPGGTFTWNGKKYTTDRADDKTTSKASNGSNMPEKPKRPVTRGRKVGMNSPEMREYRKKLSAYRKAQEARSKKSAGGRVMMKKAAAKKAAAKKAAKKKAAKKKAARRP